MYLELELTPVTRSGSGNIWWTNGIGHALIKQLTSKLVVLRLTNIMENGWIFGMN